MSIFWGQNEINGFYKWWSVFSLLLEVVVFGCAVGRCCLRLHLGIVKIVRKAAKEIKKAALHSGASVHLKIHMKRVIHISLAGV